MRNSKKNIFDNFRNFLNFIYLFLFIYFKLQFIKIYIILMNYENSVKKIIKIMREYKFYFRIKKKIY